MVGQESLPLRRLRAFQPLDRLTDDQLVLLANRAERRRYGSGQRIIERGVRDGMEFFLISGQVELVSADGRKFQIQAESEKAVNPIARLQPRIYTVTAVNPSEFLVIPQDQLVQLLRSAPVPQVEMDSGEYSGETESVEHELLMEFYAQLRANQLSLPSVPDMARKVRRLVDGEDTSADQVAHAVSADPAMAAKLVRACNSPLYRGFSDIRNVREAVVRLGMQTTRQLVTVFSMRELFRSTRPSLQKQMDQLWRHSREVAALCWVLADSATDVDPEEALLAGLLHDIGVVPILVQAEHHPKLIADQAKLDHAITELRGDVGSAVLENWGFPAAFLEAARHAEDWAWESADSSPQLADIVIVAQLHSLVGAQQNADLPPFEQVPAYRRLGELELNATRSLEVLTQARSRIEEVHRLLSIH